MWGQLAQDILDAVTAAVAVDRAIVAPGPDFRRDCRMAAVHMEAPDQRPIAAGDPTFGPCATVTQVTWRVSFTAACFPAAGPDGSPPPEDDVTALSAAFLDDVELVHRALVTLCSALGRRCSTVSLGAGQPSGPSGTYSTMSWPLVMVMA